MRYEMTIGQGVASMEKLGFFMPRNLFVPNILLLSLSLSLSLSLYLLYIYNKERAYARKITQISRKSTSLNIRLSDIVGKRDRHLASHSDAFVRKLNTNIERYDTALKRRQGRKASDKTENGGRKLTDDSRKHGN